VCKILNKKQNVQCYFIKEKKIAQIVLDVNRKICKFGLVKKFTLVRTNVCFYKVKAKLCEYFF